jgi:RNA polymerase sigma factor (sigma-70 family)
MTPRARRPTPDAHCEISATISQYGNLVATAARRVVGSRGDIDDIVQETWCAFVRGGHAVREPHCLGGWLYRVATNAALRAQRKCRQAVLAADPTRDRPDLCDLAADIAVLLDRNLQRQAVSQAMKTLNTRERALLDLLFDESDLAYREISARSGIPMGSLGPTRDRAIRKLRAIPEVRRLADTAA